MTDLIWSCPKCGGSNESVRVVSGKSKFWSKRILVPLTAMVIFSSLLPQQVANGSQSVSISQDGLEVKVYPVYAPDMNNDRDCTEGSIGVSRIDGLAFQERDTFSLYSSFSEGGAGFHFPCPSIAFRISLMKSSFSAALIELTGLGTSMNTGLLLSSFSDSFFIYPIYI